MADTPSLLEEFAGDNYALTKGAEDALRALNDGDLSSARQILEKLADPKWLAPWHCAQQYNLEMAR